MLALPRIDRRGWLALWAQRRRRKRAGGGVPRLNTGLASYWKLDEGGGTRFDSVGSNHLVEAFDVVSNEAGLIGFASSTSNNGSTDNFLYHASPSGLDGSGAMTFSIWVKPCSYVGDLFVGVAVAVLAANWQKNLFGLQMSWSGSGYMYLLLNGAGGLYETSSIISDQWNHVVMVYRPTGIATVYANGSLIMSVPIVDPVLGPLNIFVNGMAFPSGFAPWSPYPQYQFTGTVDEFGIWNRELSIAEIATLYNSGAGLSLNQINNQ